MPNYICWHNLSTPIEVYLQEKISVQIMKPYRETGKCFEENKVVKSMEQKI